MSKDMMFDASIHYIVRQFFLLFIHNELANTMLTVELKFKAKKQTKKLLHKNSDTIIYIHT